MRLGQSGCFVRRCYHAWCRSLWNSSLATVPQPPVRVCSSEVVVAVAATLHDPAQTHLIHVLRQAVQRGDGGGGADEGGTDVEVGLPSSRLRRCLRSRATNRWENIWHTFRQPSEANSRKINIVPFTFQPRGEWSQEGCVNKHRLSKRRQNRA